MKSMISSLLMMTALDKNVRPKKSFLLISISQVGSFSNSIAKSDRREAAYQCHIMSA